LSHVDERNAVPPTSVLPSRKPAMLIPSPQEGADPADHAGTSWFRNIRMPPESSATMAKESICTILGAPPKMVPATDASPFAVTTVTLRRLAYGSDLESSTRSP